MKGTKNEFVRRRRMELLAERHLPDPISFREWRMPPDAREYARRYHVWQLLEWYHEQILFGRYFGIRNRLRRLWWRISGQRVKLFSPWKQLVIRDMAEAELAADREFDELEAAQARKVSK